jgi:subtilisin family serine protease
MKRYIILIISILTVTVKTNAQNQKLSAVTQLYLAQTNYLSKGQQDIRALIDVKPNTSESILTNLGVKIHAKINNIWSVSIPIGSIPSLTLLKEVNYIESTISSQPTMRDTDYIQTRTHLVHQGFDLPKAYTGKNVVVGIIDIGFDYNNPAFYDFEGNCRIKKVWEQNKNGKAPVKFGYGNELNTPAEVSSAITDRTTQSHGTMVAGIAAGNGIKNKNNANRGVAFNADLVLVGLYYGNDNFLDDRNTAAPSFIDAITYIFDYANEVNKPAVINISWGHHAGAHDGTSLLDKAFDMMTGNGKIIVNAAGNEGTTKLHLSQKLTNDTFYTYSIFNRNTTSFDQNLTDFWGSAYSDFKLQISISDTFQNIITSTNFVAASSNGTSYGTLYFGTDSLKYWLTCEAKNPNNQKPHIFVQYLNSNHKTYKVLFGFTSTHTILHAWNCGYDWNKGYPSFLANVPNQNAKPNYIGGNNEYTNGESGSNSNSSISVGSYNSNVYWDNYEGIRFNIDQTNKLDTITGFSSRGPTTDDRTKPDITAPGYYVGGPASYLTPFASNYITDTFWVNNKRYDWIMSSGTSFSAPLVTGAVALMLEQNPLLTPNKIKNILKNTARIDSKTGIIPPSGNNNWGWGKIDDYNAVKNNSLTSTFQVENLEKNYFYPNPFTNELFFTNPNELFSIKVYDYMGKMVFSKQLNTNETINLSNLNSGIYTLQAFYKNNQYQIYQIIKQ